MIYWKNILQLLGFNAKACMTITTVKHCPHCQTILKRMEKKCLLQTSMWIQSIGKKPCAWDLHVSHTH